MLKISPDTTRIGWIGTGVMGRSMCGHLLARGYAVTLTTRTRAKADPLLAKGAHWRATPREVAAASDVIVSMVGLPDDVRAVMFGEEGVLHGARAGSIVVDMSTSAPALARELDVAARARGVVALDAPVSGGDVGAREARLSIMIGGDEQAALALAPIWETLGKTFVRQGGPGAGQHTKLVNQTLIAGGMIGLCEALLYAHRAGLDLQQVLVSVSGGAAGSWSLTNYAPRILRGDFEPGFMVERFLKDLALVLEESRRMGLALPGLALAHQLYLSTQAIGLGKKGTHALQLALARLSNVDLSAPAPPPRP